MIVDAGDVWVADAGGRHRVLTLTGRRVAQLTSRVVVAPEIVIVPGQPTLPSWVAVGKRRYAIERMQSLPIESLLRRAGRASNNEAMRSERVVEALFS